MPFEQMPLVQMSLEENVNRIFLIRVNGLKTTIFIETLL
jgi:hypothetical protein